MVDAQETDYDSLEIRPRKPKLTYGRKGKASRDRSQSVAASARPTLPSPGAQGHQGKSKAKAVRPRLIRATSASELGKRRREKAREESESSEAEEDERTRHPKKPRANVDAPAPISSAFFYLDPVAQAKQPFALAEVSPKTKRTASATKSSKLSKSRSLSSSTRRNRGAGKGGRLAGAETDGTEEEGEDDAPRKKREIRRVILKEKKSDTEAVGAEDSAEKMDVETAEPFDPTKSAPTTQDAFSKPSTEQQQQQSQPQYQGQPSARSAARHTSVDPQLPPSTPRQLVLGDKSNQPRPQQKQRLSATASPRQHARSASTTGAFGGQGVSSAMGASPRGVARHASTGGVAGRGSIAGSPSALSVYRDQPASTSRLTAQADAETNSLNLQALSSALPSSAPLSRTQPSRSQSTSSARQKPPSTIHQRPFSPRPSQAATSSSALIRTTTAPSHPAPRLGSEEAPIDGRPLERSILAGPPPLPSDGSLILPRTDGDHSSIVLETYEAESDEEEDEIVLAMSMVVDGVEAGGVGALVVGQEQLREKQRGHGRDADEGGDLADDESDPIDEQEDDTIKMHDDASQFHDPTVSISAEVDAESKELAARDETAVEAPRFTSPFQQTTSPFPQSARTRVKVTTTAPTVSQFHPPSAHSAQPPQQQAQISCTLFRPPSTSSEIFLPRFTAPRPHPRISLPDPSSTEFDPFAMPSRLPRLPLIAPRDTGPLSDEDDLEYFIATTGTYSSEDEEEWKKSEREMGEGVRAGGVRGGGRRRKILGMKEVQRVDESMVDELGIGWEEAMRVVDVEKGSEAGAEEAGGG